MERQDLENGGQLETQEVVEMDIIDEVVELEEAIAVTPINSDESQHLRMLEALLFAAAEPVDILVLEERMPEDADVKELLVELTEEYKNRGVHVTCVSGRWCLRTAPDLSFLMEREKIEPRRLSKAGIETLSIVAYHQPVTRAEIEEVRGVAVSKGTIDLLMEIGWICLRGRRRTPGRPVTYGTTPEFLIHFGIDQITDLPGLDELKGAGLLDGRLPPGFSVPAPQASSDDEAQSLEDDDEDSPEFQMDFIEENEGDEAETESSHPEDEDPEEDS